MSHSFTLQKIPTGEDIDLQNGLNLDQDSLKNVSQNQFYENLLRLEANQLIELSEVSSANLAKIDNLRIVIEWFANIQPNLKFTVGDKTSINSYETLVKQETLHLDLSRILKEPQLLHTLIVVFDWFCSAKPEDEMLLLREELKKKINILKHQITEKCCSYESQVQQWLSRSEPSYQPVESQPLQGAVAELDPDNPARGDDTLQTSLAVAIENGDVAEVTRLLPQCLQHGWDINSRWPGGNTALERACFLGHVGIVKALVEKKANVNTANARGESPLFFCMRRGNKIELIDFLLEHNAEVDHQRTDGCTPLCAALNFDIGVLFKRNITSSLLRYDADPNKAISNLSGVRPLCLAAKHAESGTIERLVKARAEPNYIDSQGESPLGKAIRTYEEALKPFIDSTKPTLGDNNISRMEKVLHTLLESGANTHLHGEQALPPILMALESKDVVRATILKDKADISLPIYSYALISACKRDDVCAVGLLLLMGVNPLVAKISNEEYSRKIELSLSAKPPKTPQKKIERTDASDMLCNLLKALEEKKEKINIPLLQESQMTATQLSDPTLLLSRSRDSFIISAETQVRSNAIAPKIPTVQPAPTQRTPIRKKLRGISERELSALLIPDDRELGEAVGDGGCFFDALAQALNEREKSNLHSEKSLRRACLDFYNQNKNMVDTWNAEAHGGIAQGDNYYDVQYTAEDLKQNQLEMEIFAKRSVIQGRPAIDGRILCYALNLPKIHLIQWENGKALHIEVTAEKVKRIDAPDTTQYFAEAPVLITDGKHFVSILQKNSLPHVSSDVQMSSSQLKK